MTHGQAVRELCTMLQRTVDVASPVERFRGVVTACHLALDDLPVHLHDALTRESLAAPDSRARWDQAMGRCKPATIEAFAHGFAVLLEACQFLPPHQAYDHPGGPDVIGSVDMDLLTGRSNRWHDTTQCFTPWNVAYAMTQMSGVGELEARFHAEVKRLLADDPVLQVMTLTASVTEQDACWWWLSKAWPFLKPKIEPVTVCDPCVYSGMDIDPLCVEMCRLNLRLYGVVPLRIEPVTLEALGRLKERARPWVAAYKAAVTAPPLEQPALQHAVVEQMNRHRREQFSLLEEEDLACP
jgi:hypothetical protein